jgi:hypothetical protein
MQPYLWEIQEINLKFTGIHGKCGRNVAYLWYMNLS